MHAMYSRFHLMLFAFFLPELPGDALLREGAPYPPEPPNWNVKRSKEQTGKKLQNYFIDGTRIESAFRKYFRRASYDQVEFLHGLNRFNNQSLLLRTDGYGTVYM